MGPNSLMVVYVDFSGKLMFQDFKNLPSRPGGGRDSPRSLGLRSGVYD